MGLYLKAAILVVVLGVGGVLGYYFGSLSGREAKESLQVEKKRSDEAKKDNDLAVKTLQDKIASLTAEHSAQVEVLNQEKSNTLAQFASERKGRTQAIQDAAAAKAALDKKLEELDAQRRVAAQGSIERKNIEAEMGRLSSEDSALQKRESGLECGKVPLPLETLAKFSPRAS